MKLYELPFLGIEEPFSDFTKSAVALLPVPYQGGVSYGTGAEKAPRAIVAASQQVELYDELLNFEPYRVGISTLAEPDIPEKPDRMIERVYRSVYTLLQHKKWIGIIGGDHSISSGTFRALKEYGGTLSAIHIDAHADLRHSYEDSIFSHASVMARIREMTSHTLHLGIRSMCREEAELIKDQDIPVITMHKYRSGEFNLDAALEELPDPVFLTFDVDALDFSVVSATGTPEPGGFRWYEILSLLERIFQRKNVIGFDVVELAPTETDRNSSFAVAKLVYKIIGFKTFYHENQSLVELERPIGSLFL